MKNTLLSAALIAALILPVAAIAADTASITIVDGDFSDTISVPLDDMKVGDSRQLTADSGLPAIVRRSEDGLSIEVAGHTVDVPFHDAHLQALHVNAGEHPLHVVVDTDASGVDAGDGSDKRIVVKHLRHGDGHHGDGELDDAEIEAMIEKLRDGHGDGEDGERRVVVIRKVDAPEAQAD